MAATKKYLAHAGLIRRIASFVRNHEGVSAIEFSMLLPLMLTLYLGTVEISQGVAIDRKVTLATRAVADLASQLSTISTAEMANILKASATVISPFDQSQLKVVVSGVNIDAAGAATIAWSTTLNGVARTVGTAVTVPASFKTNGTMVILGEASYLYTPAIAYVMTGSLNLTDRIFMRPRLSDTVSYPS
jgi:Flp pilus assembly protein TadG